ncbi:uncharacterized protein LOC129594956 isoform X1 [Paramacrobiotus metropolitanus]|uniref:uncharacterized protein LOC129594956 isoform X1 n=1 Tax=Paramacrobiotus metropolitanus TaxID=2943436 RepID=UPI002445B129|nr:uncharacterized protein LOC129594956 isoform X1 [Paramacrobiotus metropolitanus]XP_055347794.1 uncharacterized protein LOC129594956 isoform X1 [Paramacrobiotus metropolitanus]XP_055347796.1 uncharacterized protein LOC129594956 isoform X1 [Paramacrobiotus metropolitanus]XP_055347798.1 uncharacterized protein LOC129594956 isoform X1 [Paramacrobiotus metropolitanus]
MDTLDLQAISIQLGTSCYRIGRLQHDTPEVLSNAFGNAETPAYFTLDGQDSFYGDDAVAEAGIDPHNTTKGVMKCFSSLHRSGLPSAQQSAVSSAAFILEKSLEGLLTNAAPTWQTKFPVKGVVVAIASAYLEHHQDTVENAVKKALHAHCTNILTMAVPKSIAGFVSYAMHNDKFPDGQHLVIVIGATVTEIRAFDVRNQVGNPKELVWSFKFGGQIFDDLLAEWCCDEFQRTTGIDARLDLGAMERLLVKCESVKRKLSAAKMALVDVPRFIQNHKLQMNVSREDLERLGAAAIQQFTINLQDVAAKVQVSTLSGIAILGGASRMPCLQKAVFDAFPHHLIKTAMNPVAHVAVLNGASYLTGAFASPELYNSLSSRLLDIGLIRQCASEDVLQYLSSTVEMSGKINFLADTEQPPLNSSFLTDDESDDHNSSDRYENAGTSIDDRRHPNTDEGNLIASADNTAQKPRSETEALAGASRSEMTLESVRAEYQTLAKLKSIAVQTEKAELVTASSPTRYGALDELVTRSQPTRIPTPNEDRTNIVVGNTIAATNAVPPTPPSQRKFWECLGCWKC